MNTESNQQLAAKFQVSAIPLLLIFRNGQVVQRFEGVTDEQTLRAALTATSR